MGFIPSILLVTIYLAFILMSISNLETCMAKGRVIATHVQLSQNTASEKDAILRGKIGSSPPRCDQVCNTCGHCEAIQVPTNPPVQSQGRNSSAGFSNIAYARNEDDPNYKPISWKCKCGNSIFDPPNGL